MNKQISAAELLKLLVDNKHEVMKRGSSDGGYGKIIGELLRLINKLENDKFFEFDVHKKYDIGFWHDEMDELSFYI